MVFTYDLLRLRPVRVLVRWGGFPYVFQALMLAVFVGLAWLSWGVTAPEGAPDKLFAETRNTAVFRWVVFLLPQTSSV